MPRRKCDVLYFTDEARKYGLTTAIILNDIRENRKEYIAEPFMGFVNISNTYSVKEAAERTSINDRAVGYCVRKLQDLGVIKREVRKTHYGTTTVITIIDED